jgi:hypothetical protein
MNNKFLRYEALKAEWIRNHPKATPQEYQEAIKAFARKCGL